VTDPSGRSAAPDRLDRPFADPLFERLFPPLPAGVHWGLERVEGALDALGRPERRAPALHVGGTNGKGSVASTCASVLRRAGWRVGLYTSPHLCSVRERFQIDGVPIAEERLIACADAIRPVVVAHGLTFFEAATVLAFQVFAEAGVEVQVIEVGLGGRLDATNVLVPAACALTNVALDHAEYLGDTLEEIAAEKAGILKPGVPAVTAEVRPGPLGVFRRRAGEVGAPLGELDPRTALTDLDVARDHTEFSIDTEAWGTLRVRTPLVGRHQAANAGLAVRLLELLPATLRPSADAVREGVASVRWPGRDQLEEIGETTWLFDVAHNIAGIQSLVSVVDRLELARPRVALVGVLGDKEWRRMLPPLLERVDRAVLTQPPSAPDTRRWDPEAAAAAVAGLASAGVEVVGDFDAALERVRSLAAGGTALVTGSCHTVGDALRALDRVPFSGEG
jgi:dihydrofolate synthase/folylpolyglutamate synthase